MNSLVTPLTRLWKAALLATALGALPTHAQNTVTVLPAKVRVEVELDGGNNQDAPFASFYGNANEIIVNGRGHLPDSTYNISGVSPAPNETYDECPIGSLGTLTYPFASVLSSFAPSQQPTVLGAHRGVFELFPNTGQMLDSMGLPITPGQPDPNSIPYRIATRFDYGSSANKHFYPFEYRTGLLVPHNADNGFPVDDRTGLNRITVPVGIIHVIVLCDSDPDDAHPPVAPTDILKVDAAEITATTLAGIPATSCLPAVLPGATKARVNLPATGVPIALEATFYVEAGHAYNVTLDFSVTTKFGSVPGRCTVPSGMIVQGQTTELQCTSHPTYCDDGNNICFGFVGELDMVGTAFKNTMFGLNCYGAPSFRALNGPLGVASTKYAIMGNPVSDLGLFACIRPDDNYIVKNPLPSDLLGSTQPNYIPNAQFHFPLPNFTGGAPGDSYEYMDITAPPHFISCIGDPICLGTLFRMTPGSVQGTITIKGPESCPCTPSITTTVFNSPCVFDLREASHVSASGRGIARSTIRESTKGQTSWVGKYKMLLSGTDIEPSTQWKTGGLQLNLPNSSHTIAIENRLAGGALNTPVTVVPNGSITFDHQYCISNFKLRYLNPGNAFIAGPWLRGSGSYTGTSGVDGQTFVDYLAGPTIVNTPMSVYTQSDVVVALCLPEADYDLYPSISIANDAIGTGAVRSDIPSFKFKVGCGVCYEVPIGPNGHVGPTINVSSECVSNPNYLLQGTVNAASGFNLSEVHVVLNNSATPIVLCSGTACGPSFNLNSVANSTLTLSPCINTIMVSATDDRAMPLTSTATFTVTLDNTPPTIGNYGPLATPATIVVHGHCEAILPDYTAAVLAVTTDDCTTPVANITQSPQPGTTIGPGSHTITFTACDNCNNCSVSSTTITVACPGTLTLDCPDQILICTNYGCGQMPDVTGYLTALSLCNSVVVSQNVAVNTSVCPDTGPFSVIITAADNCGNMLQCTVPLVFDRCCVDRPPGLVNWWTFDELATDSFIAKDSAGADDHGVTKPANASAPSRAPGIVDNAICFSGDMQWMEVSDSAEVRIRGNCNPNADGESITIDAWINPSQTAAPAMLIDKRQVATQNGYFLSIESGGFLKITLNDSAQHSWTGTYAVVANQWNFIAVTLDRCGANTLKLFVNGAVESFSVPVLGKLSAGGKFYLGRQFPPSTTRPPMFYAGCIDELEFFKRALSPAEIAAIRHAGSAGKCKDDPDLCRFPIAHYPMDGAVTDIAGNHQPTSVLSVTFGPGQIAQGVSLAPNATSAIEIPPTGLPSLANPNFTFEAWVRPDGIGVNDDTIGSYIMGKVRDGGFAYATYWRADGTITFLTGALSDAIVSANKFPTNCFHHVVGTYDGTDFLLYVNGNLEGSRSSTAPLDYSGPHNWTISGSPAAYWPNHARNWVGVIDAVKVWCRALSANEVRTEYLAGNPDPFCPCVVDPWVNVTAKYPGPKLVHIVGPNTPCCGSDFVYHINYGNNGSTPVSGAEIQFSYPSLCSIVSINPSGCSTPISTVSSPGLETFSLPTLNPGDQCKIAVKVHLTCDILETCRVQPTLLAQATILPSPPAHWPDCNPTNNVSTHSRRPCCSYDPNDCTVIPKGCGPEGLIHRDQTLTYLVQFQNEGSANAEVVVIQDVIDADLDLNTLEVVGSSHRYRLQRNERELLFILENINLPPQSADIDGSHGFVSFRIRPRSDAPVGTIITNLASIYFDANDAIDTVTTTNAITESPVPKAAFVALARPGTGGTVYDFTYTGGTPNAAHFWSFGPNANPPNSTAENPSGIVFQASGAQLVSLETGLGDCTDEPAVQRITAGTPQLSIARTADGVGLSWSGLGYRVEETASLAAPVQWSFVTETPVESGGWSFIQLPPRPGSRFYRLVMP